MKWRWWRSFLLMLYPDPGSELQNILPGGFAGGSFNREPPRRAHPGPGIQARVWEDANQALWGKINGSSWPEYDALHSNVCTLSLFICQHKCLLHCLSRKHFVCTPTTVMYCGIPNSSTQALVLRLKEAIDRVSAEREQRASSEIREKEQNKRQQRQLNALLEETSQLARREGEATRKRHELVSSED